MGQKYYLWYLILPFTVPYKIILGFSLSVKPVSLITQPILRSSKDSLTTHHVLIATQISFSFSGLHCKANSKKDDLIILIKTNNLADLGNDAEIFLFMKMDRNCFRICHPIMNVILIIKCSFDLFRRYFLQNHSMHSDEVY